MSEIKARLDGAIETLKMAAVDKNVPQVKAAVQQHMDAEYGEFTALRTPEQARTFADNMKARRAADVAMSHDVSHNRKAEPASDAQSGGWRMPSTVSVPFVLHVGVPQGEIAQNVRIAGGFGGGPL